MAVTINGTNGIETNTDTGKLKLGADDDLHIYHDGSNARADNSTGYLTLRSNQFALQNSAGDHDYIMIPTNEAGVELYYDNAKKFNTTSSGVAVTGILSSNQTSGQGLSFGDDVRIDLGTGDDLKMYHDGTDSYIVNTTGELKITDSSLIRFNTDDFRVYKGDGSELTFRAEGDGGCTLFYDNSGKLETTSSGISISGSIGGASTISTSNSGDAAGTFNRTTSTGILLELRYNGTNRGTITTDGSVVAFNTSASDRTLKKNFEDWTDSVLPGFKALKPQIFNFTFEEDGNAKHKGYIAQDNVAAFPEAYPKDDDDKYQFNPSGMTHYLMKAVQELSAEVETLKTKVAALEAA